MNAAVMSICFYVCDILLTVVLRLYTCSVAITILTLGVLYGVYTLGPPVWWRIQATIIKPFEDSKLEALDDDPFSAAFIHQHQGDHACTHMQAHLLLMTCTWNNIKKNTKVEMQAG